MKKNLNSILVKEIERLKNQPHYFVPDSMRVTNEELGKIAEGKMLPLNNFNIYCLDGVATKGHWYKFENGIMKLLGNTVCSDYEYNSIRQINVDAADYIKSEHEKYIVTLGTLLDKLDDKVYQLNSTQTEKISNIDDFTQTKLVSDNVWTQLESKIYVNESTQTNFTIKYSSANELKLLFACVIDDFKDEAFAFIDSLNNHDHDQSSLIGITGEGNWMA